MVVDRLIKKMQELRAPIVVGLDPQLSQIPEHVIEETTSQVQKMNNDLSDEVKQSVIFQNLIAAFSFKAFMKGVIDQVHDLVPAVKLQIALYEQLGPVGVGTYFELINYARSKGLIVIGDIKRGDIASSAIGYSTGHIGFENNPDPTAIHAPADFATINPYLGKDSIDPFLDDCKKFDRGLFVLVKTSNKGSADIQDVLLENGKPLYVHVGKMVSAWGEGTIGEFGYSRVGAVVGATHPAEALEIRKLMPHTFFLVPGYGAQGGSGRDLSDLWIKDTFGMIVNSSRGITGAFKSDKHRADGKDFAKAARAAVIDMKKDLEAYIP